jgi:hypothetical protein
MFSVVLSPRVEPELRRQPSPPGILATNCGPLRSCNVLQISAFRTPDALFYALKNVNLLAFMRLRTLYRKHPGVGVVIALPLEAKSSARGASPVRRKMQ